MSYPHPYPLDHSTEFCGYQKVKKLGSGSYGQVSEVVRDGKTYALKVERFSVIPGSVLSEVIVSTQCEHPNINSAVDIFFDCDDGYMPPPQHAARLQTRLAVVPAVQEATAPHPPQPPQPAAERVTVLQCNESLSRCRPVDVADLPANVGEIPVLSPRASLVVKEEAAVAATDDAVLTDGVVDVPLTPLPSSLPQPPPRPLPPLPPVAPYTPPPTASVKMVAELSPRGTLQDYLTKYLPSYEQRRAIAFQVADGLGFMHENRLVHGDLKPANVLTFQGRAALTDFGLATFDFGQSQLAVIQSGMYRAPEVFLKANSGMPADVWSYGVLLWRIFDDTGFLYPVADVQITAFEDEKVYLQRAVATLGHGADWPVTVEQRILYRTLMNGQALPRGTYELPPLVTTDYTIPADALPQLRDLLRGCLQIDYRRRLTMDQVLRHPFFTGLTRNRGTWHGVAPPIREPVPKAERIALLSLCTRLGLYRDGGAHALDLYQQASDVRRNTDDWRPRGNHTPPASADRAGMMYAAVYIAAVCSHFEERSAAAWLARNGGNSALTTDHAIMQYVVRLSQLLHYRIQPDNLFMVIGDNDNADRIFDRVIAGTLSPAMATLFRERRYRDLLRRFVADEGASTVPAP